MEAKELEYAHVKMVGKRICNSYGKANRFRLGVFFERKKKKEEVLHQTMRRDPARYRRIIRKISNNSPSFNILKKNSSFFLKDANFYLLSEKKKEEEIERRFEMFSRGSASSKAPKLNTFLYNTPSCSAKRKSWLSGGRNNLEGGRTSEKGIICNLNQKFDRASFTGNKIN